MNDELSERDYERMLDTVRTASEWHGGQWSALYSYASTGTIHSQEHRENLLAELEVCEHASWEDDVTELEIMALGLTRRSPAPRALPAVASASSPHPTRKDA